MDPSDDRTEGAAETASILADLKGAHEEAAVPGPAGGSGHRRFLVVVAIGVIGGASLWGMRTYVKRAKVTVETPVIEVDAKGPGVTAEQEAVLAVLAQDGPPPQVPKEEITRNPFELALERGEAVASAEPDQGMAARLEAERRAKERREAVARAYSGLRLTSIIGGSRPLAMISGGTYAVGGRVGEYFTVVEIQGRGVVLEADGERYELRLRD